MTRNGKMTRRLMEFSVVRDQVKRRKNKFIEHLLRHLPKESDLAGCLNFIGAISPDGYGSLSFRHKGEHVRIHVHRIFMILQLGKPIPVGHDAGHTSTCRSRSCVRHIELQHHKDNAVTNNGKKQDDIQQAAAYPF